MKKALVWAALSAALPLSAMLVSSDDDQQERANKKNTEMKDFAVDLLQKFKMILRLPEIAKRSNSKLVALVA